MEVYGRVPLTDCMYAEYGDISRDTLTESVPENTPAPRFFDDWVLMVPDPETKFNLLIL